MASVRFAVDWDGTAVTDSWPKMGTWMPGAIDALRALLRLGQVCIYTCRIGIVEKDQVTPRPAAVVQMEIDGIRKMLDEQGLHAVTIHTHPWKPSADEYIDNKARRYAGRTRSWERLVDVLEGLYA